MWIAGLNGVEQVQYNHANMQPGNVVVHNKKSGAGSDYVYQVYPDTKGRIWMATDGGGVVMYENGKYTQWKNGDGINRQCSIYHSRGCCAQYMAIYLWRWCI